MTSVYVLLNFSKQDGVDKKYEQAEMEADPNEEEMEDMRPDDERERH